MWRSVVTMALGRSLVMTLALPALLVSACVAEETAPPPRAVVVNGPPPAPVQEQRPAPPSPGAVWVAGYWHWSGMQYTWIPGHWDEGRSGTWHAPSYSFKDGTYFYEPGGWAPR